MTTDASAEIMAATERGKQILADWESYARAAEAKQQADKIADIARRWQPFLATIQQAAPGWVHPYITPEQDLPVFTDIYHDSYYRPATIDLSSLVADIPPIHIWAKPHDQNPSILFAAGRYSLVYDNDAGRWCVATRFDIYNATQHDLRYFLPGNEDATDYFHAILAEATENIADLAKLQTEADIRNNTFRLPPAEPVKASVPPAPIEPLERIAVALERIVRSNENAGLF